MNIQGALTTTLAIAALTLSGCPKGTPQLNAWVSGGEGFDTTSWWVDTGAEVVVFDAQFTPEIAEAMIADIRAQTASPIRYLVVTHPNPDKFNGAEAFSAIGAEVVASADTVAAMPDVHAYKEAYFVSVGMFEAGSYPAMPSIDIVFDDSMTLDLDGAFDIDLVVLDNPGVTVTQTVGLMPGAVVVGDLVAGAAHAWLEGGIVEGMPQPDIALWVEALHEVSELTEGDAIVYPGRGVPGLVVDTVPAQQAYLLEMESIVGGYVDGLDDPMADLTSGNAGTHYSNITAEAEAAFPNHSLSYLVTYGVYGLALQTAAEY